MKFFSHHKSRNCLLRLTRRVNRPIMLNQSKACSGPTPLRLPRHELADPREDSNIQSIGGIFVSTRTFTILLVVACLIAGTQSLWGQNAAATTRGLRSYFDPQTRTLIPLPLADLPTTEEPAALTTYTGTFVYDFTITVKANITSTAKIQCTAMVTLLDTGSGNEIVEQDTVVATRGTGTATCSPTINYSWNLASGSTDKVTLGWIISAPAEASVTASLPSRLSEQIAFSTISVPSNGTTTTETLKPTF
jgi:hypothetical protein